MNLYLIYKRVVKMLPNLLKCIINQTHKIFTHFVYAQLGYNLSVLTLKFSRTLTTGKFYSVSLLFDLFQKSFPVVSLYKDNSVFYCTAGAT